MRKAPRALPLGIARAGVAANPSVLKLLLPSLSWVYLAAHAGPGDSVGPRRLRAVPAQSERQKGGLSLVTWGAAAAIPFPQGPENPCPPSPPSQAMPFPPPPPPALYFRPDFFISPAGLPWPD